MQVNNFTVTATEDASTFTTANLAQFKVVIFLNTTGDVLDATQQTAFESYINGGGGYVGVHSAADTEYDWPYYGTLVGAWFSSHPAIQQVTARVEDRTHPATSHLAATWVRTDELYNYRTNPRPNVRVLINLDEGTYSGGTMGDHPITSSQSSGRAFYTGLGHTQASYSEAAFRTHLLGGIPRARWSPPPRRTARAGRRSAARATCSRSPRPGRAAAVTNDNEPRHHGSFDLVPGPDLGRGRGHDTAYVSADPGGLPTRAAEYLNHATVRCRDRPGSGIEDRRVRGRRRRFRRTPPR